MNRRLDIQKIMEDENKAIYSKYAENSFPFIFWKTQMECMSKDGNLKKGIRWHPLIIKWCLYLKHQSSKSYETLRQSGISLPSQRTLRDSNAVKAGKSCKLQVSVHSGNDWSVTQCAKKDENHFTKYEQDEEKNRSSTSKEQHHLR